MRDNEFSNPGREYASSGREFSGPGREWASQPAETDRSGREYKQELIPVKPVKKKRRRAFRPAALTAATLVTASIALGSVSLRPPRGARYPTQELSAEHRAYLDTVWETMERSDLDALGELARDPALEDIVVNVVDPFLERVKREYNSPDGLVTISNGHTAYTFDLNDRSIVHYSGEVLAISDTEPNRLSFAYTESVEPENRYTHVYFVLNTNNERPASSNSYIHNDRYFDLSLYYSADGHSSTRKDWHDRTLRSSWTNNTPVWEPLGEWSQGMIVEDDWPNSIAGRTVREERMNGGFFGVTDLSSPGQPYMTACLYNGRITSSYWQENGPSVSGTVYVENGYTTGWDGAIFMEDNQPVPRPMLRIDDYRFESLPFTRHFVTPDSDDPLFAQFTAGVAYQSGISAAP